jgi:CRISPR/Cas system CMR subunit Cmr4 (Cas7 group RAMP superfamily)
MPVSRLNIAVRRPLERDVTQAPIIPSSQVETVLRNPTIKRARRDQFLFYYEKKRRFR